MTYHSASGFIYADSSIYRAVINHLTRVNHGTAATWLIFQHYGKTDAIFRLSPFYTFQNISHLENFLALTVKKYSLYDAMYHVEFHCQFEFISRIYFKNDLSSPGPKIFIFLYFYLNHISWPICSYRIQRLSDYRQLLGTTHWSWTLARFPFNRYGQENTRLLAKGECGVNGTLSLSISLSLLHNNRKTMCPV